MNEATGRSARGTDEELDMLLTVLSSSTRRDLLRALTQDSDGTVTFDDLHRSFRSTEERAARADDLKTALYHTHLPLLSDARIVDVDWERETVRFVGSHLLEPLLELVTAGGAAIDFDGSPQ